MQKLYFTSLGCNRNLVDSEVMIDKLLKNNLVLSDDIINSDLFVINTCGFLKEARDEAFVVLDEIFLNKKKSAKVIVTGCMANVFSNLIKEKYPEVFSILSTGNIDKIFDASLTSQIKIDNLSYLQKDFARVLTTPSHLTYVKVSEGCYKACAFCIIPKIKGKLVSRTNQSILKEINLLLSQNVFEINLIAQDLLDYGKDRNEKNALINLIKEILKIDKKFWLRLLYVYPDEITDELIELISQDDRICKYIEMPIQHVNNRILKLMKRKTSKEKIEDIFKKLKSKMPSFSIRTSLMVGFPSETEEEFLEMVDFIKKYPIDNLAVFKYSNEKLSQSYNLENQIDEEIKQKRFEILTKEQFKQIKKRQKKLIGQTLEVLIDGYHKESDLLATARHQGQCFEVDSNVLINDISKIKKMGSVHRVKIIDNSSYDLIAEII
ncbi:MAG: ribosomal protein S12 methylthiotransferase RimO [Chlamydiae bacterium RIFCSPLOWO2_01_FULL_28_7]|nr:MAG: ribosomal protein S12 methylthiotransferase RimO [Chlamydiae bacterium RIFCSPLOWO2_01_FULL_28_7]